MRRSIIRWLGTIGLVAGCLVVGGRSARAQSGYLQPGDVAVTCVDTSGTGFGNDLIQVTPLVPLPALTDPRYRLQYTDLEADVDGTFYDFDENYLDIPLGGAKRAGEPTRYAASALDNPPEQVFLFQGVFNEDTPIPSPGVMLWGFQVSAAGGWAAAPANNLSALPRSLVLASVGVKSKGGTAFAYTGPTTGSRLQLQAAIANPDNWTADAPCPDGLTVTDFNADGIGGSSGAGGDAGDGADGAIDERVDAHPADADGSVGDDSSDAPGTGGVAGTGGTSGAGGVGDSGGTVGAGGWIGTGGTVGTGGVGGAGGSSESGGVSGAAGGTGAGGAPGADGAAAAAVAADAADAGAPGPGVAEGDLEPPDAHVVSNGSGGGDGGGGADRIKSRTNSGCSCSAGAEPGASATTWLWLVLALSLLARKRTARSTPAHGQKSGQSGRPERVTT